MTVEEGVEKEKLHSWNFLRLLGVPELPPLTSTVDVGENPAAVEGHLEQSAHLISFLKLSICSWLLPKESAVRRKIAAANRHNIKTVAGAGPFEIAVAQQRLEEFLDLCTELGISRIECGDGFTEMSVRPKEILRMAHRRGLETQFELGRRHSIFTKEIVHELIEQGDQWLDAGTKHVVIAAKEFARGAGIFDNEGRLNRLFADRFARAFELDHVMFETPTEMSQFALMDHFGREVHLSDVRFDDLFNAEAYRRGLHAEAFGKRHLRPRMTHIRRHEESHEKPQQ